MQTHEKFTEFQTKKQSSNRSFGLVMATAFAVIGLVPLWNGNAILWWSFLVAMVFLALSIFYAKVLEKPKLVWLKFGELLHHITNPIILGLMFFTLITPMALLLRVAGKDLVNRKLDPKAKSYWIRRDPPGPEPSGMENQF